MNDYPRFDDFRPIRGIYKVTTPREYGECIKKHGNKSKKSKKGGKR